MLIQIKKIAEMHQRFGVYLSTPPNKCKDCTNFRRYRFRGKTYSKCVVYGESNSQATDWNGRNVACGMFNKDYNGTPIYLRHFRKDIPMDGQMSFMEVQDEA